MRILLVHNLPYFPSYGGGSKSDRLLINALADRGNCCRVIAAGSNVKTDASYIKELVERGITPTIINDGLTTFFLDSVEVHVVISAKMRSYAIEQINEFAPDVTLISTDPLNTLIAEVVRVPGAKVVYVARTTMLLPFGPESAFPSASKTDAIRKADAVVTVSRYLADYIFNYTGINARHLPIQLVEPGDWPLLANFENAFVTIVNPCALKGMSIFIGLADAFPESHFAAVPTWGTTPQDLADLVARRNIHILAPSDDIRDILRQTRVMLVPSLWAEARGRIVLEAMLSGIPTLASDRGGIAEAAMGVGCLLPVNPIVRFQDHIDERNIRVPEVPVQNIAPWRESLAKLLTDRDHYAYISRRSREAAQQYVKGLNIASFESLLAEIIRI